MNVIGNDVFEEPLIMGDHKDADLRAAHRIDSVRHHLQRVDIEAAVGLVEHRVLRLQHRKLQNFVPLLFAAGKSFVD